MPSYCIAETLTKEQWAKAISSLLFFKEKRDGTIKGRACAIDTPQRSYIKKEDAASPTCATESVFITSVVDTTNDVTLRHLMSPQPSSMQ